MEREELWGARVREWRSSGMPLSGFCRDREFSAQALRYWVKRLESPTRTPTRSASTARAVRIARVVRSESPPHVEQAAAAAPCLVIESGALRLHVPASVECTRLEALLAVVGRAAKVEA